MTILTVYDSVYGNTKTIAKTIDSVFKKHQHIFLKVDQVTSKNLKNIDLLIIGSPTYGGRPTEKIKTFIDNLKPSNFKFACFDTSLNPQTSGFFLKLLLNTIGNAAPKISTNFEAKGLKRVGEPISFIVTSKTGPLEPNQIKLATSWAKKLIS